MTRAGGAAADVERTPPTADVGTSPLELIERDVRELMRAVAVAQRSLLDQDERHGTAMKHILLSVIEAIDAFDRVFRNIHDKEDQVTPLMKIWVGNFRTVRRLLEAILKGHGVRQIENLDQGFDSRWHKVAAVKNDPSLADGTIIEEVVRGYVWQSQLLRKADVIVVRHGDDVTERDE